MKPKLFLISLVALATLMMSCRNDVSEKDMKGYLNDMLCYYPYALEEDVTFVNDSLGQTFVVRPKTPGDGIFPTRHIIICSDGIWSKCRGDKSVSVSARMNEKDASRGERFILLVSHVGYTGHLDYENSMDIEFSIELALVDNENYYGAAVRQNVSPEDVYSCLSDTILIPITQKNTLGPTLEAPEGAYARIVKGQGLTDFSIDGKTVWRRERD